MTIKKLLPSNVSELQDMTNKLRSVNMKPDMFFPRCDGFNVFGRIAGAVVFGIA